MAPPLAARFELPVGYGSVDAEALQFSLADDVAEDVTFLRLFLSTTYVDLSVLEQLYVVNLAGLEQSSAVFGGGEKVKSSISVASDGESTSEKVNSHGIFMSGGKNGDQRRGGRKAKSPAEDVWDVWTYVLRTTREERNHSHLQK
jgi:hypothetical protein